MPGSHLKFLTVCVLVVAATVGGAKGQDCELGDPCPGQRPPTRWGCCPARAGEACGDDAGQQCDSLLGYRCLGEDGEEGRGICRGPYDLRTVRVGPQILQLDWSDFLPTGFESEYSLMYRQHNFSEVRREWRNITCGDRSSYTLHDLLPATWYFIRVGVFRGPYETEYANISETLMVRTRAVEYCEYDERQYEVGETFDNECEDRCTCLDTGKFKCVELCPQQGVPQIPSNRQNCSIVRGPDCCPKVECQVKEGNCERNGTEYEHGDNFQDGCRSCQCRNGIITCSYSDQCRTPEDTNSCSEPVPTPIPDQCCPQWECANSCEYDGLTYSNGNQWADEHKCEVCRCQDGQVMCHEMCTEPEIPANCSRPLRKRERGGCCVVIECLPSVESCFYNGQTIQRGNYFTNLDCELCMCTVNSTVECSPQCAPVPLPAPSSLCPRPQLKKQGCCDTLWCEDPNEDLISTIRNLFATSFSPHSITLSFNDQTTGSTDNALSKYELLYAQHTADVMGAWRRDIVWARPLDDEGEISSPTQLLQTTGVLRVGERVYVTLSGMQANTTYYIKIRQVLDREHNSISDDAKKDGDSYTTSAAPNYAGAVVVKTLPTQTVCEVNGHVYKENDRVHSACGDECRCRRGHVECRCRDDDVIMVPSSSCPRPRLEKANDTCCPQWRCYPADNGCRYKSLLLKDGERVRDGCREICDCDQGQLKCSPVCEVTKAIRPECVLRNLTNHCCPVWMCTPDLKPPQAVNVTIRLEFREQCQAWNHSMIGMFERRLLDHWQHVVCPFGHGVVQNVCGQAEVKVRCPRQQLTTRRRREINDFSVDVVLSLEIKENEVPSQSAIILERIAREILSHVNNTIISVAINSHTYTVTGASLPTTPVFICDNDYIYNKNACTPVLVTDPFQPPRLDVTLSPVSVSSDSATLEWSSLEKQQVAYVTGVQIEYRRETYLEWRRTARLGSNVTRHTLTKLHADCNYRARLVIFTSMVLHRMPMSAVTFRTEAQQERLKTINLQLEEVNVGTQTVTIKWTAFQVDVVSGVRSMEVAYCPSERCDRLIKQRLQSSATECVVSGLQPATVYTAHLIVVFKNGTQVRSSDVHFVTRTSDDTSRHLILPLAVSIVIVVCATAIVVITCCIWRRSRKSDSRETSFENKVFGIQIQNEGRTLSART